MAGSGQDTTNSRPRKPALRKIQEALLDDWELCMSSTSCSNGCCSAKYSRDGKLRCTPLDGGFLSDTCVQSSSSSFESSSAVLPITTTVETGTCGSGNRGNGICADGTCCSDNGYCGTTPEYCQIGQTAPPSDGFCGSGLVGNGICADGTCCSQSGWCGTTPEHCSNAVTPFPTPAATTYVTTAPTTLASTTAKIPSPTLAPTAAFSNDNPTLAPTTAISPNNPTLVPTTAILPNNPTLAPTTAISPNNSTLAPTTAISPNNSTLAPTTAISPNNSTLAPTSVVSPGEGDAIDEISSATSPSPPPPSEKSFNVRRIVLACAATVAAVVFLLVFFTKGKGRKVLFGDSSKVGESGKPEASPDSILKFWNWNRLVTWVTTRTPAETTKIQRIPNVGWEPLEEPSIAEHSVYTTREKSAFRHNLRYPPSMISVMEGGAMADFSVSGVSWQSPRVDDPQTYQHSGIYREPVTYKETGTYDASTNLRDFTIAFEGPGIRDSQLSEVYGASVIIGDWDGKTVHPDAF